MAILDWLLGKRLSTIEEDQQQIGPLAGIPVLGLDALSSAAYGPEAALTVLIPLGAAGLHFVAPLGALIVVVLLVVFVSYRQTIAAYPGGGGSYTVAKENLGSHFALLSGAALALDYVLNVAVGISAGVGALVSVVPALLPHTLALCLTILVIVTLVNLRGIRESGTAFMLPTYLFVVTLGAAIVVGLVKTIVSAGHPVAVVAPPACHHRHSRVVSGGHRPLDSRIRNWRHAPWAGRVSEHPVDAGCRRRGSRSVLLRCAGVRGDCARAFRQHELRGFPTLVSRSRGGWLFA